MSSALEKKINNLSYILTDLQGKVKHAEEEKASLITVIRLLNNNHRVPNDRVRDHTDANLAVDQDQQNQTSEHLQPIIPVNNSFMVLNVEETNTENDEPSISVHSNQQHAIQTKNVPILASKMSVNRNILLNGMRIRRRENLAIIRRTNKKFHRTIRIRTIGK